ncbi:MAG TPA: HTTM domain-containing protein [Bacteroidia bacterium]|nr:HTTM domain-containing protein [Bacteroidia bacterium]
MYKAINNYIDTITTTTPYAQNIKVFRKALLIFLLCNTLLLLSYAKTLYGAHSYFLPLEKHSNSVLNFFNLLEKPNMAANWKFFVGGQILSIIACLFLPYKRLSTILVYFFTMSLYYKTIPIQNGGFNLLVIVLFLLIFMDENADAVKHSVLKTINITVSNFAVWAARFQIIILYIVASYFKLFSQTWLNGTAFYYVLYNDTYSLPFIKNLLISNSFFIHAITWFALIFQLLFPVLVWFKKIKPFILFLGILFHLMIIFVMGITDFGIIMIIMYLLFYVPKFLNQKANN